MSNRYWVGDGGTWDPTSTTHWSASSGGAGGASVPVATDDVFFDANSFTVSGTVTIRPTNLFSPPTETTVMGRSIDFSAITQPIAVNFNGFDFEIYGNLTLNSLMTISAGNGQLTFKGSGTSTLTSGGVILGMNVWSSNIVGGTLLLADDLTFELPRDLRILGGVFDSNGKTITSKRMWFSTENADVTVYLRNSTVNLNQVNHNTSSQYSNALLLEDKYTVANSSYTLTFDAGTSTINLGVALASPGHPTPTFEPGGKTFYNVVISGDGVNPAALHIVSQFVEGIATDTNAGFFHSLTFNGAPATITIGVDSETFTMIATTLIMQGSCAGDITIRNQNAVQHFFSATTTTFDFVDIRDIQALGTTPFIISNGTDSGNNTNLHFNTVLPVCYNPSIISSVQRVKQNLPFPQYIIGGKGGSGGSSHALYKKTTTTGTVVNIWRSQTFEIGKDFDVTGITFNLNAVPNSNTTIIPSLYFDDGSFSVVGTTINSTNYSTKFIALNAQNFGNSVHGKDNFFLEFQFTGSTLSPICLPIYLDVQIQDV